MNHLYREDELIDTDVLLDILQDITIEKEIDVYINKRLSYDDGDFLPVPKHSIGTGYVKRNPDDNFGVYEAVFRLPGQKQDYDPLPGGIYKIFTEIKELCKRACHYYNSDRSKGEYIVPFNHCADWYYYDVTNVGSIVTIRIYFTRENLFKYVLTRFHQVYDVI